MATWVTVQDEPHRSKHQALKDDSQETVEVKLYAMRSSYHKALILQQDSIVLGDRSWQGAKMALQTLITQIQTMPELLSVQTKPFTQSVLEVQSQSQTSFASDCIHILYLALKNLARMLDREPGPQAQGEAMSLSLAACSSMSALGNYDTGLMFRTALMALAVGDMWTSNQLLHLPIGDVTARTTMDRLYEDATCRLKCLLHAHDLTPLSMLTCWKELVHVDAEVTDAALSVGAHQIELGLRTEDSAFMPAGLSAIIRCLSSESFGTDRTTLRLMSALEAHRRQPSQVCVTDRAALVRCSERVETESKLASALYDETTYTDMELNSSISACEVGLKRPRDEGLHTKHERSLDVEGVPNDMVNITASAPVATEIIAQSIDSQFDNIICASASASASGVEARRTSGRASRSRYAGSARAQGSHGHTPPDGASELWAVFGEMLAIADGEPVSVPSDAGQGMPGRCGADPPTVATLLAHCTTASTNVESQRFQEEHLSRRELTIATSILTAWCKTSRDSVDMAFATLCESVTKQDSNHILTAFISAVSEAVICHHVCFDIDAASDGVSRSDSLYPVDLSLASLDGAAQAVVAAWKALCAERNMHIEPLLQILSVEEQVLLGECCAEVARLAKRASPVATNVPEAPQVCSATLALCATTLDAIIPLCYSSTAPLVDYPSTPASMRAALLHLRQLWLCATCVASDANRAGSHSGRLSDLTALAAALQMAVCNIRLLRLPHCSVWAVVDTTRVKRLSAVLLDDGCLRGLVQSHSHSHCWFDAALSAIAGDNELGAAAAAGAHRRPMSESWLPLLCLSTGAALGRWHDWLVLITRLCQHALPTVVGQLREGCEEQQQMQSWLVQVMVAVGETIPVVLSTPTGPIEDWNAAASEAVLAAAALVLHVFEVALTPVFDASWKLLLRCCTALRVGYDVVIQCFESCAAALTKPAARTKSYEALAMHIATFGLQLAAGALSHADPCAPLRLARVSLAFFAAWGATQPIVALAAASVSLHGCLRLPSLSPQSRLDAMLAYHAFACDENLWACDQGVTLLAVAQALHAAVCGEDVQCGLATALPLAQLSLVQQTDLCSCLGEMYWLLYAFPLCSFSYSDGRGDNDQFRLPLTASVVATLYRYYQVCVGIGLGHKADRRASLLQLTHSPPIQLVARESLALAALRRFLFEGHPATTTREECITLFAALQAQARTEAAQAADKALLAPVLASIYADRCAYLADANRELPGAEEVCEALPAAERWYVHCLDLCSLDLSYAPLRAESWQALYESLSGYLLLTCDQVGEACVPSALAECWHDVLPCALSFQGLRDGSIRQGAEGAAEANAQLLARLVPKYGLSSTLAPAVAAAWGSIAASVAEEAAVRLSAIVVFKNYLFACLERVYTLLMAAAQATPSDVRNSAVVGIASLAHGRLMLTLAHEYSEGSRPHRERQAAALQAFQISIESGGPGTYVCAAVARLHWANYGQQSEALAALADLQQAVHNESGRQPGGRAAARLYALTEASSVLASIALWHLRTPEKADSGDIEAVKALLAAAHGGHKYSRSEGVVPVASGDCRTNLLWLVILNCVGNFREVRRADPHDFRSVHALAVLLRDLSQGPALPTWVATQLIALEVPDFLPVAAFREMRKLFVKRLPQLVGMWAQGKTVHEWELELHQVYHFDSLRRQYVDLYLATAEAGGESELQCALDLLRDALCVPRPKQTAAVRWIIDRCALCVAEVALRRAPSMPANTDLLRTVFEVFQVLTLHAPPAQCRVSDRTLYRLQRGLHKLHSELRPAAAMKVTPYSLADCLYDCFAEFGARPAGAGFTFVLNRKSSVTAAQVSSLCAGEAVPIRVPSGDRTDAVLDGPDLPGGETGTGLFVM